jgi:hypothetical protein
MGILGDEVHRETVRDHDEDHVGEEGAHRDAGLRELELVLQRGRGDLAHAAQTTREERPEVAKHAGADVGRARGRAVEIVSQHDDGRAIDGARTRARPAIDERQLAERAPAAERRRAMIDSRPAPRPRLSVADDEELRRGISPVDRRARSIVRSSSMLTMSAAPASVGR